MDFHFISYWIQIFFYHFLFQSFLFIYIIFYFFLFSQLFSLLFFSFLLLVLIIFYSMILVLILYVSFYIFGFYLSPFRSQSTIGFLPIFFLFWSSFLFHFQKWWIVVATKHYIVQPVQTVMENGGAMENVNGKMDNVCTLCSHFKYCYYLSK